MPVEHERENFLDEANNELFYQGGNPKQETTDLFDTKTEPNVTMAHPADSACHDNVTVPQRGLHPSEDIFEDETYVAGGSFMLLQPPETAPAMMEHSYDEDAKHLDQLYNHNEDMDKDGDENQGIQNDGGVHPDEEEGNERDDADRGGPLRPPEPDGTPSALTPRQRSRLQQLLESGRITRLSEHENDADLWGRYRRESKDAYRAQRKKQRQAGERSPDKQRYRKKY